MTILKTTQKLIDISELVKEYFPTNVVFPNAAKALSDMDDEDFLNYALSEAYNIWGSDCLGGIAYFGKTEDILKIEEQTQLYFQNMSKPHAEEQFYMLWQLGEYSLLMLYEDYAAEVSNPYPVVENVLSVNFGAWTDDYKLFSVLQEKIYCEENNFWNYGNIPFNKKDKQQLKVLKEMKKAVLSIDSSANK